MPHDRKDNLLAVGDQVVIPARVVSIQTGDDYCNLGLETEEVMAPGTTKTILSLNSRQVEKVEPPKGESQPEAATSEQPAAEEPGPVAQEGNDPPAGPGGPQ